MAKSSKGLTPMMQQFFSLKAKHPDALLLFRCGDFYETYCKDAIEASQILGITLTKRNNGAAYGDEMAGFPYHALDTYLPKLVRAGRRVAICDQLEDPKQTKTLVKRGITELVTPGVAISDSILNHKENNFLASISISKSIIGIALLDISTGEFIAGQGDRDYIDKLLTSFQPKEIIYQRNKKEDLETLFGTKFCIYPLEEWAYNEEIAEQKLLAHFKTRNLKGFGIERMSEAITAAGAIMQYLDITKHTQINHITSLKRIEKDKFVRLDKYTIRSLELLNSMQEGGSSLLQTIDKTITSMGARMIRRWITFPLNDINAIQSRLNAVEALYKSTDILAKIKEELQNISDLERLVSKIATGRISPREVVQLKLSLMAMKPIKNLCKDLNNETLTAISEQINLCSSLVEKIEKEIYPDPPMVLAKGRVINSGVNAELDELRDISSGGKTQLLNIQEREIKNTGIASLKIGYNNVFGYYLEVRNMYKDLVPQEWVRKQTLVQAERYITQELKEYETKILGAEDKIVNIETTIYNNLIATMQEYVPAIQTNANLIARFDCLCSFASIAKQYNYAKPIINNSLIIDIKQGRHPVIEQQMPVEEQYVPNDLMLNSENQQIIMITGPNMAGKSALLRQTALITLLAQAGSFVPAQSAEIGIVDKIFTRVGASDNISLGESTFMVEMTEASDILNNATSRSLIIFDELGRGTSTYDGISIAWAIVEFLHDNPNSQARTLFATHYHELNEMEKNFKRIKNFNVSVKEVNGKIHFLRKLERGGSEHSFGIHVATIAGMPKGIVKRAEQVLQQLENTSSQTTGAAKPSVEGIEQSKSGYQLSFFKLDDPVLSQVRDAILNLNIDNLTPIEALNKLNSIKKIITGK